MLIELKRIDDNFGFEAKDVNGNTVRLDAGTASGGTEHGARPMQLLLMGLGGCSGIDIVSILKKQRQRIDDFTIQIDGTREAGKEPSLWENVAIRFHLKGDIEPGKAQRAVELSMEKYCSVAETLRKSGTHLSWSVTVN
ncbi:MAG TPA: OsmC family protein [Dinghuibacter sp.]|jgi:putative redox protein|uniref:OsmC family protein n=1 Tax=Dinghuibacter sp. TaxID=2024697 RepID=UPI002B7EB701|nr:OsmC family protein [Dinghuibacter sp.]HTJ11487.1 OsmC family protein [Dinghuibacter sp.]